jgi:uncharacterized membrane protein
MFLKLLTVAGLATFEVYAAIPAGFAFGLSPWNIFFASTIGGLVGVYIAAFLGDKIRAIFHKNKPTAEAAKGHPVLMRIWNKFGIIGLNANMKKMATWCSFGVITRCLIFTFIGYYGLQLF